jgi:hypothetical protein
MPFMTCGRNVQNESCENEAVALRAYFKWIAADQPKGRDLEFWLAAEQEEYTWRRREGLTVASSNS